MIRTDCRSCDYHQYLYTRVSYDFVAKMMTMFMSVDIVVYSALFCCVCIHIFEERGYVD